MTSGRTTFGAFNQGGVPTIACFNKATIPLGVDFGALIAAMQVFVDRHVAPVWGTPARLVRSKGFVKGAAINLMTTGPDPRTIYAYESADPVEALSFRVSGIAMSDLVYPSYFEEFHKAGSVQVDRLKKVRKPFQVLAGGYQIIFKNGTRSQVFGSAPKRRRFAREVRRGHRSEQRAARTLRRASTGAVARAERRRR